MSLSELLIALFLISFGIFCDGGYSHKLTFGIGGHITYFMESCGFGPAFPFLQKRAAWGWIGAFFIVWTSWRKI
jgi:hypothetical protein